MDLELQGKRVLVTGASRGIGAAVAEAFAAEGASLRLAARDGTRLEELASRLKARFGTSVRTFAADLSDHEQVRQLAGANADVDILVNNAGAVPFGTLEEVGAQEWRSAWDLKVYGYIDLTRLVYASMRNNGGGVIVNDIGAEGGRANAGYVAGCTGNAALIAFTRAVGSRSMFDGIRVVGISPGPVATERLVGITRAQAASQLGDPERYPELWQAFPLSRPARPAEIADSIAFLASPRSSYTSGSVLVVDGGVMSNVTA